MTSSHYPSLYCLVCGLELSDFDSLEEHTNSYHKSDPTLKRELERVIKAALTK